jgi:hypothetical protein
MPKYTPTGEQLSTQDHKFRSGIVDALGSDGDRNVQRWIHDSDPANLRMLIESLKTPENKTAQKVLGKELERVLGQQRDFTNVSGADQYNPGSHGVEVESPPEVGRFHGPAGIPSRWRKPVGSDTAPGAIGRNYQHDWRSFLEDIVKNNIPLPEDVGDARIQKLIGMLGPGAMNMLAGKMALTAPAALKAAKDVPVSRVLSGPSQNMWREQGMAPGREGKMRFEISDELAHVNPNYGGEEALLENVMRHPRLYEAYPDMRKIPVLPAESPGQGAYYMAPRGDFIEAAGKDPRELLRVLLHESQHGIQTREGFAGGGNPRSIASKLSQREVDAFLKREYDRVVKAGMKPDEAFYHIEDFVAPNAVQHIGMERYGRRAGEVEARNVERRWADPILRRFDPAMTEDVPRNLQILTNVLRGVK